MMDEHEYGPRSNDLGQGVRYWFRCTCRASGRARGSEAEARADWEEHVRAEKHRVTVRAVVAEARVERVRRAVERAGGRLEE